jgi:hypothetical protein
MDLVDRNRPDYGNDPPPRRARVEEARRNLHEGVYEREQVVTTIIDRLIETLSTR